MYQSRCQRSQMLKMEKLPSYYHSSPQSKQKEGRVQMKAMEMSVRVICDKYVLLRRSSQAVEIDAEKNLCFFFRISCSHCLSFCSTDRPGTHTHKLKHCIQMFKAIWEGGALYKTANPGPPFRSVPEHARCWCVQPFESQLLNRDVCIIGATAMLLISTGFAWKHNRACMSNAARREQTK